MQKVQLYYHDRNPNLQNRLKLKHFVADIFKREGYRLGNLAYIFCSDEHLLAINLEFLNHDYYTDVITFDLSTVPKAVEGEIYISIDRIKDNAQKERVSVKEELHRVIFHGALHLCGYKDKTKVDLKIMRAKEDCYLKKYFD